MKQESFQVFISPLQASTGAKHLSTGHLPKDGAVTSNDTTPRLLLLSQTKLQQMWIGSVLVSTSDVYIMHICIANQGKNK